MIAATAHIAHDQRPLIEVTSLDRVGRALSLVGTAVAYEGTVLIDIVGRDGVVLDTTFATASAGGPSRGAWSITLSLPDEATKLVIRQEEMAEGAASASGRRLVVSV